MKIEWLLAELDKEIHDYTELREQLGELLSGSDEYTHAESDLRSQIMRLKVEIDVVLNAIGEADNQLVARLPQRKSLPIGKLAFC